jgi:DNA polymerase III epsilon subunit-like protein
VGVDVGTALDAISHEIDAATALVAHNMSFDEKILGSEPLRAGRPNTVEVKPRLCTMQSATSHCRIPGPYGYKWPTLQELYKTLFKQAFTGAHHALTDARACAKCYFELKRLQVI